MNVGSVVHLVLMQLLTLAVAQPDPKRSTSTDERRACEARFNCDDYPAQPVCGNDGVTYANHCHLDKASYCDPNTVHLKIKHQGECSTSQEDCLQQRAEALAESSKQGTDLFVPVCLEDGKYVEIQCFHRTGDCWCVNEKGQPIPGTSTRYERPKCPRRDKKRRDSGNGKKAKRRRACIQADRIEFNTKVTDSVMEEYRAFHHHQRYENKTRMIEWKFAQLDRNRDGVLKRKEFRDFGKKVKKLARNRVCGRHFWHYCDQNSDRRIDQGEWTSCLGHHQINIYYNALKSLNSEISPEESQRRKNNGKQLPSRARAPTANGQSDPNRWLRPSNGELTDLQPDCRSAHLQTKEESIGNGMHNAFIPECDELGNYKKVQCTKDMDGKTVCWCVNPKTGQHISGSLTNTGHVPPGSCDLDEPSAEHEWKKCPASEKSKFLTNLMTYLTNVMRHRNASAAAEESHEIVAKWHFHKLDTNRDKSLSRKELRPLRRKLSSFKELKRCGKRIQLHCDPDGNKSIEESEWLACVLYIDKGGASGGVSDSASLQVQLPLMNVKNRKGPNPVEKWLKAD